jgi:methionyl aminopeptidase
MINIYTQEEVELLRENNLLVSRTLAEVGKNIKPGVTTLELDRIAEEFIRSHGAVPGFLGYGGFPNTLCVSVNENVVHGIPSNYVLKEGDVVEFGGLLGSGPLMPVNPYKSDAFIARGGRIPAPIHSLRN